jgi:NTE family protein
VITIRLKERPSQLVRFGVRADTERHLQGLVDVRDENFQGSGMDLGLTIAGGERNLDAVLEYKARRLFDSYLTLGLGAFYRTLDSYLYADAPVVEANRWTRDRVGEYRDIRYGVSLIFGGQLERLGNATIELLMQDLRIKNLDKAELLEERYRLAMVRLGTIVDTKDRFPFPLKGVGLNLSYEFAFEGLGSEISYNALRVMYETYTTWGGRHTFHPRITMGFADKTMPAAQQFRLGGRESFFGLREDDRRGRQLLLFNVEYRYFLPFRVLFDAYLRVRYDLGTISAVPEEIKFSTLRHGLGAELALDTPLGQAAIGVGKSFYFSSTLPDGRIQYGPFVFTFMIGYQL